MKRVREFRAHSPDGRDWLIEVFQPAPPPRQFGRLGKYLEPPEVLRTKVGDLPVTRVDKGTYEVHGHGGTVLTVTSDSADAP